MRVLLVLVMGGLLSGCAGVVVKSRVQDRHPRYEGLVCLIQGKPDVGYAVVGRVLVVKRTYGELENVVKPLADEARAHGANAVVEYENSWRFSGKVSGVMVPMARGLGVIMDPSVRCETLGGIER